MSDILSASRAWTLFITRAVKSGDGSYPSFIADTSEISFQYFFQPFPGSKQPCLDRCARQTVSVGDIMNGSALKAHDYGASKRRRET
jgi:hypothetical protein